MHLSDSSTFVCENMSRGFGDPFGGFGFGRSMLDDFFGPPRRRHPGPSGHSSDSSRRANASGPIVEEPDDDRRGYHGNGFDDFEGGFGVGGGMMDRFFSRPPGFDGREGGAASSSSFFSSSSSFGGGGSGGTFYSKTTTRTVGPGGVMEERSSEKDSRSLTERVSVKRKIGDKTHMIERTRDGSGREETIQQFENLPEEETNDFDQEWESQSRALPRWSRHGPDPNAPRMLDYDRSSHRSRRSRGPVIEEVNDDDDDRDHESTRHASSRAPVWEEPTEGEEYSRGRGRTSKGPKKKKN